MKKNKRRKPRSASKRNAFLKVALFAVFAALVIVSAVSVLHAIDRYTPDIIKDQSPFETQFFHGEETAHDLPDDGGEVIETTEPVAVRPVIEDHTRKEGMYNFLIIGRDSVAFNTDVIMLISYDTVGGEVNVMQIPRDTYIEANGKAYKINALYAAMYNKAKFGSSKDPLYDGMVGFVEALEMNMYIQIDYWAVIKLDGFSKIIDSIGGVEVDIPFEMDYDDPIQDLHIHLKPGVQTLNGEQAEQFVRFRAGYVQADIGRINAQKIFLSAFVRQLKNNLNVKTISTFVSESLKHTMTSIELMDCVYFAKTALDLDLGKLKMFTLPGIDTRSDGDSGTWYYVMHREDTLALINRYFNVYKSPITDKVFDSHLAFTNESKEHMHSIYLTKPKIDPETYGSSATDINDNSIDIPLLNK